MKFFHCFRVVLVFGYIEPFFSLCSLFAYTYFSKYRKSTTFEKFKIKFRNFLKSIVILATQSQAADEKKRERELAANTVLG